MAAGQRRDNGDKDGVAAAVVTKVVVTEVTMMAARIHFQ